MCTSRRFCIVIALIVSFAFVGFVTFAKAEVDSKLKADIKTSMDKGIKWLMAHQESDGSFEKNAGITALAATAFMRSPQHYTESNSPNVKNAIKYIVSKANPDGSIFDTGPASYTTAVAIMALVETKNPAYKDIIKKAQGYIVDMQLDEGEKVDPSNPLYGGFGYSKSDDRGLRGDMSNIHFSLEALKASSLPKDSAVWDKAIKFIERCQNRSESNDQKWAGNDGGFIYSPTPRSPAGETKSYASMTYSGIESFIYAKVDKKDPRVQDAVKWIQSNYSLDENTPIGANGLYYYYHTMAKAFAVYGEPTITDSKGVKHNWYEELARKLISLQKDDGSWVNTADRWMETKPTLVTTYGLLALAIGYNNP